MVTLYVIRHGETEWNVANRVQGGQDSSLTAQGIKDVLRLKDQLDGLTWKAVYTSPRERALHTAKLLYEQQNQIIQDHRLREMSLGSFEGMTWKEIRTKNRLQYYYYWNKPDRFTLPCSERFIDVKKRVKQFLKHVKETYEEGNILIVTHGVIIKIIQLIEQKKTIQHLWETPHVRGATINKLIM